MPNLGSLLRPFCILPGESRQVSFAVQGLPNRACCSHRLLSPIFVAAACLGRRCTVSALWDFWLPSSSKLLYPPRHGPRSSAAIFPFSSACRLFVERPPHLRQVKPQQGPRQSPPHPACLPSLLAGAAGATQTVLHLFLLPSLLLSAPCSCSCSSFPSLFRSRLSTSLQPWPTSWMPTGARQPSRGKHSLSQRQPCAPRHRP